MKTLVSFTILRNQLKDLLVLASLLIGLLLTSCTGIGLSVSGGSSFLPNLGGSGLFSSNLSSYQASFTAGPNTKISVSVYKLPEASTVSVANPVAATTNSHVNQINARAAYSKGFYGQGVTIGFIGEGLDLRDGNKGHLAFGPDTTTRIVNPARFIGTVSQVKTVTIGGTIRVVPAQFADEVGFGKSAVAIAAGSQLLNNNHLGVAVSADIMPIDIAGFNPFQPDGDIPTAIKYATDNHAKIINYGITEFEYVHATVSYNGNRYYLPTRSHSSYYERLSHMQETSTLGLARELKSRASLVADAIGGKDVVIVAGTGNNYTNSSIEKRDWNSENGRFFMYGLDGAKHITVDATSFVNNATLESFKLASISVSVNQSFAEFFGKGNKVDAANQPVGTFAALPFLDKRLGSKYVLVAGVDSNDKIYGYGCGASKWWCISAPTALDAIVAKGDTTLHGPLPLNSRGWNAYSSAVAAGALAVIQSRIPNLPVVAARAVMFKTADDLGARGVDAVYGHGLINLGNAMSAIGSISVAVPVVSTSLTLIVYRTPVGNIPLTTVVRITLPVPTSKVVVSTITSTSAFVSLSAPARATSYTLSTLANSNITLIGADKAYERGYFGQNVTIAFVGSGINKDHIAFAGRIVKPIGVSGTTFVDRVDYDLAGTYVAALAVGAPRLGKGQDIQSGIAPQAKIMPIDMNPYSAPSIVYSELGDLSVGFKYAVTSGAQIIHNEFIDPRMATVNMVDSQGRKVGWKTSVQSELLSLIDRGSDGSFSKEAAALVTMIGNRDLVMIGNSSGLRFNDNYLTHITVTTDSGSKIVYTADEFKSNVTIMGVSRASTSVTVNSIQVGSLFTNGLNGVAGIFQNYPYLDSRLRSKFLIVGGVKISNNLTVLVTSTTESKESNGCGASKHWCLVAPRFDDYNYRLPINNSDDYWVRGDFYRDFHVGGTDRFSLSDLLKSNDKFRGSISIFRTTSFDVAPVVAGALAVLKSRFPNMPMAVIRAILLKTATDLGEPGVDDIYGHGMVNLGKAITLQGEVSLPLFTTITTTTTLTVGPTETPPYLLKDSNIVLSPAMSGLAQGVGGISMAVGLFDDYFYDTPFSSVLKGNINNSNQLGFGLLAREEMSAQTQSLGGFGLRRNSTGGLVDLGIERNRIQLNYSICTLGCSSSAWDEYKLDNEPLPFFADTKRKFSSGWKVNDQIGTFVVLGLDDENDYDKYSQYGINWKGVQVGEWELAGSFSSIKEQEGYVLGSKFNGAYSVGETTSQQIGLRAQRYIDGWRLFGAVDYGKTKVDTLQYSSIRAIDDVQYAGWRFGLDKDSVLRGNDKIRFGLTKIPSVISGNMELLLSHTTGDTGFDEDLQTDYLNKTEFREHNIDLDGSDAFVYRLGYSTNIHKRQRLALGFEHYTDKVNRR